MTKMRRKAKTTRKRKKAPEPPAYVEPTYTLTEVGDRLEAARAQAGQRANVVAVADILRSMIAQVPPGVRGTLNIGISLDQARALSEALIGY